jgi:hypothetical protein
MTRKPSLTGRSKAGQIGGTQTLKKHGQDHFIRIGKIGGKARRNPRKQA